MSHVPNHNLYSKVNHVFVVFPDFHIDVYDIREYRSCEYFSGACSHCTDNISVHKRQKNIR